jgi:hypothetical protein
MTKKDFELIAKVLKSMAGCSVMGSSSGVIVGQKEIREVISHLRHEFSDELKKENPRFDDDRFYKAVGC